MDTERTAESSPYLLCAVPQLLDANFRRSVVLMLQHAEDGALGLVLNHPMDTPVSDILSSLELHWHGNPGARARLGGPVEPARGWLLHDCKTLDPYADEITPGLLLTTSLAGLHEQDDVRLGSEGKVVMLLGYAGWGAGQLEQEMAMGSWVPVPLGLGARHVSGAFLLQTDPDELWNGVLRAIGVDPAMLVGLQASLHGSN